MSDHPHGEQGGADQEDQGSGDPDPAPKAVKPAKDAAPAVMEAQRPAAKAEDKAVVADAPQKARVLQKQEQAKPDAKLGGKSPEVCGCSGNSHNVRHEWMGNAIKQMGWRKQMQGYHK